MHIYLLISMNLNLLIKFYLFQVGLAARSLVVAELDLFEGWRWHQVPLSHALSDWWPIMTACCTLQTADLQEDRKPWIKGRCFIKEVLHADISVGNTRE